MSQETFGVWSERFARFMGTPRFLIDMTVFVVAVDRLERPRSTRPALGPLRLHLPHAHAEPAGLVCRAADPARAEPPGRPRPRGPRAGPRPRRAQPRRHRVPHPRGRRAPARHERAAPPATSCAPSCAACSTSSRSAGSRCGPCETRATSNAGRPVLPPTSGRPSMGGMSAPAAPVTDDALYEALSTVIDPEIRKPVTELGMVEQRLGRRRRPGGGDDPAHRVRAAP